MKTKILNLGKVLNKADQKIINGGRAPWCEEGLRPCYDKYSHTWSCRPYCNY